MYSVKRRDPSGQDRGSFFVWGPVNVGHNHQKARRCEMMLTIRRLDRVEVCRLRDVRENPSEKLTGVQ